MGFYDRNEISRHLFKEEKLSQSNKQGIILQNEGNGKNKGNTQVSQNSQRLKLTLVNYAGLPGGFDKGWVVPVVIIHVSFQFQIPGMRERGESQTGKKPLQPPGCPLWTGAATGGEFGAMEQLGKILNIPFLQIQGKFAPI